MKIELKQLNTKQMLMFKFIEAISKADVVDTASIKISLVLM